jgi:hypothetical protein
LIEGMKGKRKILMVGKIGKMVRLDVINLFPNETPGNEGKICKKGKISYQLYLFCKWDTK